jgi:hypothetical protein
MSDFFSFDTLSLHAGQTLDPEFGSRAEIGLQLNCL